MMNNGANFLLTHPVGAGVPKLWKADVWNFPENVRNIKPIAPSPISSGMLAVGLALGNGSLPHVLVLCSPPVPHFGKCYRRLGQFIVRDHGGVTGWNPAHTELQLKELPVPLPGLRHMRPHSPLQTPLT